MNVRIADDWLIQLDGGFAESQAQDGWKVFTFTDTRRRLAVACYDLVKDSHGKPLPGFKGDLKHFLQQVPPDSRYYLEGNGELKGAGTTVDRGLGLFLDTQTINESEVLSIAFSSPSYSDLEWALTLWSRLYNESTCTTYRLIRHNVR